ncbi:endonuclease/exonuclease/phosphatase family protein [Microlunatus sp. GCM10028923]|uniref:endonuclease/exonuclease/phosphatase family protein n=1 Tax=Microlunatus sp. GCM10028923 TaxID=3273400 RepID=UPI00361A6776
MHLTVGTFNLWRSGEPWRYAAERNLVRGAVPGSAAVTMRPETGVWRRRLPLIAATLRQPALDLVGLQEVLAEDGDGAPAVEALAEQLDLNHAGAGQLAVLTPHPIRSSAAVPLAAAEAREEADGGYGSGCLLHAVVATPGGDTDFVVTHWSPRSSAARTGAAAALTDYVADLPNRRLIVVGDLNTVAPETPELIILGQGVRPLVDAWAEIHPDQPGYTMPSHDPVVRLDYVFVSPDLTPVSVRRIGDLPDPDGFYPSDHLGVVATVVAEPVRPV